MTNLLWLVDGLSQAQASCFRDRTGGTLIGGLRQGSAPQRTEDAPEGPKAFAEKRKPEWTMR
jgi:hypothetical protein